MGAETSVVIALFFVGFSFVAIAIYSSNDYATNLVKNAQVDQDTMKKDEMQTDITITNVIFINQTSNSYLNMTIKNTGKTTLNASSMEVLINGTLYDYSLLTTGNTWVPKNQTNITIYPLNYTTTIGSRIKIVTGNGISDYAIVPG
ncbi:MAG: hypothetical protein WC568_07935 [Candidatus Methanoperedens sp.]